MKHIKSYDEIRGLVDQGGDRLLAELLCARMGAVQSAFRQAGAVWSAEEYGYFCLIEQGDDVTDLESVGLSDDDRGLIGAIKEVVLWHPESRCWEAVILYGGDYGMTFICPDAPWLDPELRAVLEAEARGEEVANPTEARRGSPF